MFVTQFLRLAAVKIFGSHVALVPKLRGSSCSMVPLIIFIYTNRTVLIWKRGVFLSARGKQANNGAVAVCR
jgi:hypothetical protein